MDPKQLKKLAAECRKSGIKHFKCAEFEFTLSDEPPAARRRTNRVAEPAKADLGPNTVESDELSPEALLYWSISGDPTAEETEQAS